MITLNPDLKEENIVHQFMKESFKLRIQRNDLKITQYYVKPCAFNAETLRYETDKTTEITIKKTDRVYLERNIDIGGKRIIPDLVVLDEKKKIDTIIEIIDSGPPSFEKLIAYANGKFNVIFICSDLPINRFNLNKREVNCDYFYFNVGVKKRDDLESLMILKSQSSLSRFKILSKMIKFDLNHFLNWNIGHFPYGPKNYFLFKDTEFDTPFNDSQIEFNGRTSYDPYKDIFSRNNSKKISQWLETTCNTVAEKLIFKERYYNNKTWNQHYIKIDALHIMDNPNFPTLFVLGNVSSVKSFNLNIKSLRGKKIGLTWPRKYAEKDTGFDRIKSNIEMGYVSQLWFQVKPEIKKSDKGIKVEGLWRSFYSKENYNDTYREAKKIKYFTVKEVLNEME